MVFRVTKEKRGVYFSVYTPYVVASYGGDSSIGTITWLRNRHNRSCSSKTSMVFAIRVRLLLCWAESAVMAYNQTALPQLPVFREV